MFHENIEARVKTYPSAESTSQKITVTTSDGSMSASGSAGLGFNPWRGSKFSFENFQPRG